MRRSASAFVEGKVAHAKTQRRKGGREHWELGSATSWTKVVTAGLPHLKSAVAPLGKHPSGHASRARPRRNAAHGVTLGHPTPRHRAPTGRTETIRSLFRVPRQGTEVLVWRGPRGSTPGFHPLPLRGMAAPGLNLETENLELPTPSRFRAWRGLREGGPRSGCGRRCR